MTCARHGLLFTTGQKPVSDLTANAVGDDRSEPPVADPHDPWCGSRGWPSRVSLGEPMGCVSLPDSQRFTDLPCCFGRRQVGCINNQAIVWQRRRRQSPSVLHLSQD